jgi:hypothetical protein
LLAYDKAEAVNEEEEWEERRLGTLRLHGKRSNRYLGISVNAVSQK